MHVPPITTEFSAPFAPDDDALAAALARDAALPVEAERRIDATARRLIEAIRTARHRFGSIDDLLHEFSLSTKEGLALMVLAEALLRVPDQATTDQFIEDKLREGDFVHHVTRSEALFVNASAWALGVTSQVVQGGETPQDVIAALTRRVGMPIVRAAMRRAMRVMGDHFVLGETIDAALRRSREHTSATHRYSFDMLGEGARTAADAARYFDAYAAAIDAIGASAGSDSLPARPGISVKLSALHPRYEAPSRDRVLKELAPRLLALARQAKGFDLNLTVDAEEADRLELSLDVIAAVVADPSLAGWDGFGLAIQAYQKRAGAAIDYVDELARAHRRRLMVRLVKGAYWDTEVKRAQERGLDGYPVFTLKAMTDLNYLACARQVDRAQAAHLFAIRHPQCAHRRLGARTRRRRPAEFRIPAPARHGRCALRAACRRSSRGGDPHLCAGRQPSRSARLPRAAAVGERRQFVFRRRRRRRLGADRGIAEAAGGDRARLVARAARLAAAAGRSLCAGAEEFARRRVRRSPGARRADGRGGAARAMTRRKLRRSSTARR